MVFGAKRQGSVLCPGCGQLVGVQDKQCLFCGRRNPALFGFAGLVRFDTAGVLKILLGANIGLFLLALVLSVGAIEMRGLLGFLSPDGRILYRLGAAGGIPVFGVGKWSAVLSAGWLHGGLLHIFFNMYWLWNLFPLVGETFGTSRALVIYQVSAATGFLLSSFMGVSAIAIPFLGGAPGITVGASASLCGLLGALLYFGRRTSSDFARTIWRYVIFIAIFGAFVPGIDNAAHLGGFLGGYFVASTFGAFTPERGQHGLWALGLVAASAFAILLSVAGVSPVG